MSEKDYVFLKTSECPVCENKIKHLVVKSGKARLITTDNDLRPVHAGIDTIKYDVIHCNVCGYAVLSRYYGALAKPHREMIQKNISMFYAGTEPEKEILSYKEALYKYKLALLNAVTRQGKEGEKALICLKTGWLYRSMQEHIDEVCLYDNDDMEKLKREENEYLEKALDGFIVALRTEDFPIAGMNEITLLYLMASLSEKFERYQDGLRFCMEIISSSQANSIQKDKARDLIDRIKKKSN